MNKKAKKQLLKLVIAGGLLLPAKGYSQAGNNDWENPTLYELSKEKPHTDLMLFDNMQTALGEDYSKSSYHQSLNGSWKFVYVAKYADRIKNFYDAGLNTGKWNDIALPSNWELKGYGITIYTNIV